MATLISGLHHPHVIRNVKLLLWPTFISNLTRLPLVVRHFIFHHTESQTQFCTISILLCHITQTAVLRQIKLMHRPWRCYTSYGTKVRVWSVFHRCSISCLLKISSRNQTVCVNTHIHTKCIIILNFRKERGLKWWSQVGYTCIMTKLRFCATVGKAFFFFFGTIPTAVQIQTSLNKINQAINQQ